MEIQVFGINTFSLVKSLISKFEKRKMGAEQSYHNNETKQYVRQSDILDKTITDKNGNKNTFEKNLRRSKSEDHYKRKKKHSKDNYHFVKQICPIINNFSHSQLTSDSNNNNEEQPVTRMEIGAALQDVSNAETDFTSTSTLACKMEPTELKVTNTDDSITLANTYPKIRSVSSLRKVFEQQIENNPQKFQLLARAVREKSRSETNLRKNCNVLETGGKSKFSDNFKPESQFRKNCNSNMRCTDSLSEENLHRTSYVDDQFRQIEDNMKEVEEHIKELKEHYVMSKDAEISDLSYISDSVECLHIYINDEDNAGNAVDDVDVFGQNYFGINDVVDFVEAFNRLGDELVITTACIERRSVSDNDLSQNRISIRLFDNSQGEASSSSDPNPVSSDEEVHSTNEYTVDEEYTNVESRHPHQNELSVDLLSNSGEEYSNDNFIQTRNKLFTASEGAVRAETIYDSFRNPRIAKVSNIDTTQVLAHTLSSVFQVEEPAKASPALKNKKDYLIEELISTEKAYLEHLEMVVCNYMPALSSDKLPTFLRGSRYIFGNINKIYAKSQSFYKSLKKCGTDHEEIGKTFIIFEKLFELYPLYSKNKPSADYFLMGQLKEIVLAKEHMLNDRLGLASHLLTPVQRLGKYILFLEQIQKEIIKLEGVSSENIHKATVIVRQQMSRGNDFIAIDSIKDSPINLADHAGSFLMREKFFVYKPKKYEAMLFLFENILIFTTVDTRNSELFIYKDSIKLTEMGIITFEDQSLSFHIKRFPSYGKGSKDYREFIIEAKRSKDKKTWTDEIEKRLWEQLVKFKEQQKALQGTQYKRNSVEEIPNRIRPKKAGYSSLPDEFRNTTRKSVFYDDAED